MDELTAPLRGTCHEPDIESASWSELETISPTVTICAELDRILFDETVTN